MTELTALSLAKVALRAKGLLNFSATQRHSPSAGLFLLFVLRMMR